jgi:glycosyltransferase involved in cell wall biosynthesis
MTRTVLSVVAIEPLRIGGAEIWLRELSERLQERGWRNVIAFLGPPPPQVRAFLALPNVTLEALPNSFRFCWQPMAGFWRLCRHYQPAIVHLQHTGFISPYPLLTVLSRWSSVLGGRTNDQPPTTAPKVFYTDQSSRPEGFVPHQAPLLKRLAARLINAPLTRLLAISNYVAYCHQALGYLPEERCTTLYNAIDVDRVLRWELAAAAAGGPAGGAGESLAAVAPGPPAASAWRLRYDIPADRTIVMQVSWMIPEKGYSDLLRAAWEVLSVRQDVHFVLVGDGAGRPEFERLARDLGITGHVTFTGIVDDPMGQGAFSAADIVCQLSRWEEGFGQVIAEAMACGKPVIGTRVGAIPELVEDGKTGYVVERRDLRGIADRILALLKDPALRAHMGQAGRAAATAKFNLKPAITELLQLYGIA